MIRPVNFMAPSKTEQRRFSRLEKSANLARKKTRKEKKGENRHEYQKKVIKA